MKTLKKVLLFVIVMMLIIYNPKSSIIASTNIVVKKPVKIGVFLHSYDEYLSLIKQSLEKIQQENKDEVEFTFFNAKENQSIQNESINDALEKDFDAFIINLHTINLNEVGDILSKVIKSNKPLILLGEPDEDLIDFIKYNGVFIASSGKDSGSLEGKIIADEWKNNKENIDRNYDNTLQYIVLQGRIGDPIVEQRTKYAISTLKKAGIKTEELASVDGEWNKDLAKKAIESLFLIYGNRIEAIISNNDEMALGAIEALQKYGYNNGNESMHIMVVGIDGIDKAKDLIEKGFMTGTVIQDPYAQAEALYRVSMNLVSEKYPLENTDYKFDDTGSVIRLPYKEYKKE
ncbi:sugar ABC transporter substrate-binding protein [Clostridium botulinum]|uniref:galactose ABC transporter substrate-binding protein n=1 Tax=Clostridium botulinum TaxID=1491 RepID=UPI0005977F0A|nr:galactose ABC transporter substrate-binding protein [Clostridium botulinum]KIL06829.1 sugar ABC transporter substrate-binding protein [Clostridium botulinum]MBY6934767.1 galactose ABC transporter substrate-binding protein [Clostridium botulinum]NFL83279.1 galactose ABC transporter substrate-binding protein [Clostridium botulinum]NFN11636.1 galactose ABC transporter substrate-binding protein [Clostridium botulinum]NFO36161.1 galactose ABC transporter substrate-binding protein [Clostridium bo